VVDGLRIEINGKLEQVNFQLERRVGIDDMR